MKAKESDKTLAEHIGALKRTMHRALLRHMERETDRPLNQLLALRVIATQEVQTQAQLCVRLQIDPPAASRLMTQLVEDGLLKRMPGRNRREFRLVVTPKAAPELKAIRLGVAWLNGELEKLIGPATAKSLSHAMERLQRGLDGR